MDDIDESAADQEAAQHRSANVAKAWWKEGLALGKTKPMPPSDWKKKGKK